MSLLRKGGVVLSPSEAHDFLFRAVILPSVEKSVNLPKMLSGFEVFPLSGLLVDGGQEERSLRPRLGFSIGRVVLLARHMKGRLRLVMVPDSIKAAVPEGFREKRAAQLMGVGIHLFRRLVRDGRIVPRLLGKTRIYLRTDLEEFLRSLPVDRKAQSPVDNVAKLPVGWEVSTPVDRDAGSSLNQGVRRSLERTDRRSAGRKGNLSIDGEALKMRSQDPARLHRKEDSLGH